MEAAREVNLSESVEQEAGRLPWLDFLGSVIVSPGKAFSQLAARPKWRLPAIIFLMWLFLYQTNDILPVVVRADYVEGESPPWIRFFFRTTLWSFGMETLAFFLAFLLLSGLCRIFRLKPRLFPLIAGLAFAEFIPRLAEISAKLAAGLFSSTYWISFYEIFFWSKAIRIFTTARPSIYIVMLFDKFEPFRLWSLALVVMMMQVLTGASLKKGIFITAVYWCICIGAYVGWIAYLVRIDNS